MFHFHIGSLKIELCVSHDWTARRFKSNVRLVDYFHNLSSPPLCLQLLFNSHCKCTTELNINYVLIRHHFPSQPFDALSFIQLHRKKNSFPHAFYIPISFYRLFLPNDLFSSVLSGHFNVCTWNVYVWTQLKGFNNHLPLTFPSRRRGNIYWKVLFALPSRI